MKLSLDWLGEYVDLPDVGVPELSRVLSMLGHQVEGVEFLEVGWTEVVVARVDSIGAHPDADKIRVCTVTTGRDEIKVVCGAWNFEVGASVAFARPGAVLPGDFEIGVRQIRGVESHGMICSESELGIGEDADGILVLDAEAPLGRPLEDVVPLPDVVFDLEITPNRPDAMSVIGLARDLAAWYEIPVAVPAPDPVTAPGDAGFSVSIEDAAGNPRFVARRVDGVEVGPSPLWMRMRLKAAGVRPVSNLVDVTNYVMLELGQPLHVFDIEHLQGDTLFVRRADTGERLTTLDGVDRSLTDQDLVICDSEGPTSLAGTMGGERSEVSATTNSTLIEAASWDPPTVMFMSRRHGLRSEASARFERGVDPELPPLATARAAELILDVAGGDLREGFVDEVAKAIAPTTVELHLKEVTRLLGAGFDLARVESLLTRLGFGVEGDGPLSVTVPTYRPDVTRAVDVVEEVARLADYDTFDERVQAGDGGGLTPQQVKERRLRALLNGIGFTQAITLPFVMPADVEALGAPDGHESRSTIEIKNPLSEEEAILRPSLLPGLLKVIRRNLGRGHTDVAVFEIGRVFHPHHWSQDARVPDQPIRLAFVAVGTTGPSGLDGRDLIADIHTATGVIRHIAGSLGLELEIQQVMEPGYHPMRAASISAGGQVIGYVGEVHPVTASAFDLEGRVIGAELDLEALLRAASEVSYRPVSPYPPTDFDLSFELPVDLPAARLVASVSEAGEGLLESVRVFDEFRGGSLGPEMKALALRVRLRAPDRTLTADEIAAVRSEMVSKASSDLGAGLRGAE